MPTRDSLILGGILFSVLVSVSSVSVYLVWRAKVLKDRSFPPRSHIYQIVFLAFTPFVSVSFLLLHFSFLQLVVMVVAATSLLLLFAQSLFLNSSPKDSECALISRFHKNGTEVEYSEAFRASGQYPRNYLSKFFFENIQYANRQLQPVQKNSTESGVHTDWNRNIRAPSYNVIDGIRVTTDQPVIWNKTCSIFGTSQSFGEEVPDDLTCASFLQRILNISDSKTRVQNHSRPASTFVKYQFCSGCGHSIAKSR